MSVVCTAIDDSFVKDFLILLYSYKKTKITSPFYVYDLGLSQKNIRYIIESSGDVIIIKKDSILDHMDKLLRSNKRFIKPFLIDDLMEASRDNVLWIDSDAMIINKMKFNFLLKMGEYHTVLTQASETPSLSQNEYLSTYIRDKFPLKHIHEKPYSINSGVVLINKKDRDTILKSWLRKTLLTSNDEDIFQHRSYNDQGSLIWALSDYPQNKFKVVGEDFNLHPRSTWGQIQNSIDKYYDNINQIWERGKRTAGFKCGIMHSYGVTKFSHFLNSTYSEMVCEIKSLQVFK